MVNSVTGELSRKDLGIITPHEHIFINLSAFFDERPLRDIENPAEEKVKMEHLGQLSRDPYALKDNLKMDDYETQKKEILRFKKAGGTTMVDATMPGIGRDPEMLKKISEETGINVIMGTGYYVGSTHPDGLEKMSEEEIAEE
ncbi:MAG: phosphotriesterase-related protein, partial [Clostridia bacterium]|nr:phosphotriesterase-related protein [Clostridia bacterium]